MNTAEKQVKQENRGGRRDGAGRKKTSVHIYHLYATKEIDDILKNVSGSKSEFISKCILYAWKHVQ